MCIGFRLCPSVLGPREFSRKHLSGRDKSKPGLEVRETRVTRSPSVGVCQLAGKTISFCSSLRPRTPSKAWRNIQPAAPV